jgi:hypothetical protein
VWKDVKKPTVDDSTVALPANVVGLDGKVYSPKTPATAGKVHAVY